MKIKSVGCFFFSHKNC